MRSKSEKIVYRLKNSCLVNGYETWSQKSTEQIAIKRKSQKIVYRLKHSCLVSCYELWCSSTKESIAVKTKSARVLHRVKNRCHSTEPYTLNPNPFPQNPSNINH